ncbi:MAG: acyl-CoA synthetase [Pseudomonadota bacterium]|nr:acyl-CoA synthetase [Pseudomonadota bacterium]
MPPPEPAPPTQASAWRQQPERSSMAVLRLMTWLSLTLGRRASRVLLYLIAAYFVLFSPTAKRASQDYLRRVLGRPARIGDGFRHVLSFASVTHDRVYWLRGQQALFDVRVSGEAHVAALRQAGRGVVFMGAHFGSFEALRVLGDRHGLDVRMLMYPDNARMVTQALAAINPALQQNVIALGEPDALLRVREHVDAGGCVGILADRNLHDDAGKACRIDFLGSPVMFPLGPFRLAALLRAPVVFMAGEYLGGNRYHLVFDPIADFAATPRAQRDAATRQAMQRYAALLEARCMQTPWNWFNFYDFWQIPPE